MSDSILNKSIPKGAKFTTAKQGILVGSGNITYYSGVTVSDIMASFEYEPQFVYIKFIGTQSLGTCTSTQVTENYKFVLAPGGSVTFNLTDSIYPSLMTGSVKFEFDGKNVIGTASWWRIGDGTAYKFDVSCNLNAFIYGAI